MGPRLSMSILSSPRDNYFCNEAIAVEVCRRLLVLLGCTDQGLVDNNAMAWNAAITDRSWPNPGRLTKLSSRISDSLRAYQESLYSEPRCVS